MKERVAGLFERGDKLPLGDRQKGDSQRDRDGLQDSNLDK